MRIARTGSRSRRPRPKRRERATRRASTAACRAPSILRPFKHLMTRIDPKQMDALLEGPKAVASGVASPPATPAQQPSKQQGDKLAHAVAGVGDASAQAGEGASPIGIDEFS